jgi:hypothetical protein
MPRAHFSAGACRLIAVYNNDPRGALAMAVIDESNHTKDKNCGNPCHPAHACSSCEPFWQAMQATGRFKAYVPPTFAGATAPQRQNFSGKKLDFADLTFRTKGSNS